MRGGKVSIVFQDPFTTLNPAVRVGRQIAEPLVMHRGMTEAEARADDRGWRDTPFREAYIQAVVDRVEVDDGVVRIVGEKRPWNRPSPGCRPRLTVFADV